MSQFIEQLKKEHVVLQEMLNGFKKGQGIVGLEWKEKLFKAKEFFISHLKKEDENLYPMMIEASATNPDLEKMLVVFTSDMKRISALAFEFLDKYKSVSGGTGFVKDFAELEIQMKNRIVQEETVLYPEYEKLLH